MYFVRVILRDGKECFVNSENVNVVNVCPAKDRELGIIGFRGGDTLLTDMSPFDLATLLNEGIAPDRNNG